MDLYSYFNARRSLFWGSAVISFIAIASLLPDNESWKDISTSLSLWPYEGSFVGRIVLGIFLMWPLLFPRSARLGISGALILWLLPLVLCLAEGCGGFGIFLVLALGPFWWLCGVSILAVRWFVPTKLWFLGAIFGLIPLGIAMFYIPIVTYLLSNSIGSLVIAELLPPITLVWLIWSSSRKRKVRLAAGNSV